MVDEGTIIPNELLARAFEAALARRFPEVDAAQSLGLLLRQMGHDVQVAHDGHAALEAARINHPQLVPLDLGMPGVDGFRVVQRLRKEAHFADEPMVAVSLETLRALLENL